jgi:putative flippase GtrA
MKELNLFITDFLGGRFGHHRVKLGKEFVKFCLVGLTNLIIYLSVYWLMTRLLHWHYLPASVMGFVFAVSWSFVMNLNWTFKHKTGDVRIKYLKFFVANLIGLGINLVLLTLFIEIVKLYDLLAQLIVTVICAFINFAISRFWTFRE